MPLYWLCYRHNNSSSVVIEPAHSLIYEYYTKLAVFRTKNSQPMGYQDRYEDSMQLDRVTRILFRLSISGIMAHSGIPTHASEGSLGPRGRCVSPRAGPLIPAQPVSHRPRQSMSALKRGDADS